MNEQDVRCYRTDVPSSDHHALRSQIVVLRNKLQFQTETVLNSRGVLQKCTIHLRSILFNAERSKYSVTSVSRLSKPVHSDESGMKSQDSGSQGREDRLHVASWIALGVKNSKMMLVRGEVGRVELISTHPMKLASLFELLPLLPLARAHPST